MIFLFVCLSIVLDGQFVMPWIVFIVLPGDTFFSQTPLIYIIIMNNDLPTPIRIKIEEGLMGNNESTLSGLIIIINNVQTSIGRLCKLLPSTLAQGT